MIRRLFFFYLLLTTIRASAYGIQGMTVTQVNEGQLNVHLSVLQNNLTPFVGHTVSIEENTITLSLCFIFTTYNAMDEQEHDFPVSIPENTDYTLLVNVYAAQDPEYTCSYENPVESVTMSFTAPLAQPVILASGFSPAFDNKLVVYPNPAKGVVQLSGSAGANAVTIADSYGRIVGQAPLPLNQLDLSRFADGLYLLNFETEHGIVVRKVMLKK